MIWISISWPVVIMIVHTYKFNPMILSVAIVDVGELAGSSSITHCNTTCDCLI